MNSEITHRISFERLNFNEQVAVSCLEDLKKNLEQRGARFFLHKLLSYHDVVRYHSEDWTSVEAIVQKHFERLSGDDTCAIKSIVYATKGDNKPRYSE
jgi:hypothetical protein